MSLDLDKNKETLLKDVLSHIDDPLLTDAIKSASDLDSALLLLCPFVKGKIPDLKKIQEALEKIDEEFFVGRKNFDQLFGLVMFPFFAFFDSMMERFHMDIAKSFSTHRINSFLSIIAHKEAEKQINLAYEHFQQSMESQLVGMEHEGAGPFVAQLSALLQSIDDLPMLSEVLEKETAAFIFEIRSAHRQLFLSEGEDWEDAAMTAMGDVLGRLVLTAMPLDRSFTAPLKRVAMANLKRTMEKIIATQRKNFQEKLIASAKPIYFQSVQSITKAWRQYHQNYQAHCACFNNFLSHYCHE
ncbi:MAG: hypothetical protein ACRCVN_05180 [Spirochaetia bacterium]